MGGGGKQPQDNSVQLMQMEQQAAREAREAELRREQQQKEDFERRLNASYNNALTNAEMFFQQRGLDPSQYQSAITQAAQRAMGNVPQGSTTPGAFFDNIGDQVYGQLTEADRAKFMRDINSFAGNDFATRRIDQNALNPTIESILAEQRGTAEDYIRNLLDRGVVTSSGYGAAQRDLDNQRYGANARLNEIGMGLVETGRSGANEIANNARRAVQDYELGMNFDPFQYSTDLDSYFGNFFENLGNNFRAQTPSNLFNTAGLAGVAGAAQGAQNTRFDPNALAGIFEDENNIPNAQPRSQLSAF